MKCFFVAWHVDYYFVFLSTDVYFIAVAVGKGASGMASFGASGHKYFAVAGILGVYRSLQSALPNIGKIDAIGGYSGRTAGFVPIPA